MQKTTLRTIINLTIFSAAMGYLECAVVIYLRKIYYPEGFDFPLKPIEINIGIVEIIREAATLVMLIGAGLLAGRTKTERFGFFLYSFAIWDIFYYLFLKLLIGWPDSLLTWDILFLIPVTWVGPVIAPVINSLTMIAMALLINYFTDKNLLTGIKKVEWAMLIFGSLVMILSYTLDYMKFIVENADRFSLPESSAMIEKSTGYVPQSFPWWLFIIGQTILIAVLILFVLRNIRIIKNT
jgi:hypothetical protein